MLNHLFFFFVMCNCIKGKTVQNIWSKHQVSTKFRYPDLNDLKQHKTKQKLKKTQNSGK